MDGHFATAERYRSRAKTIRLIAMTMETPETRRSLLEIAVRYEVMAQSLESLKEN